MDFLERFKLSKNGQHVVAAGKKESVFFQVDFDPEGRAFLQTVDPSGKPIRTDYRLYQGDTFILLRSIAAIEEKNRSRISWETAPGKVYFDEHPHLVYQLIRCNQVVDSAMTPLKALPGKFRVTLTADMQGDRYLPSFRLRPVDREAQDASVIGPFRMITDSFSLSGDSLVETLPLGGEYTLLPALDQPFDEKTADIYLTILVSHFDNIDIDLAGIECIRDEHAVHPVPTLVFEKVDEDKALHIRLTSTIPGFNPSFVEDFSPTRIATFTPEGAVRIQAVNYEDTGGKADVLRKMLRTSAPDRQAAKSLYEEDGFFIVPQETAGNFLFRHLAELAKEFQLIGAERLSSFQVKASIPALSFKTGSGIDFLEGDGQVEVEGETLSLSDFLAQYRKNRYIQLSDGNKAIIDPDYVKRLERIVRGKGKNGKIQISFFDLPEIASLLKEVPDTGIFRRSRKFYEGFNDLSGKKWRKKGLKADLRPYQEEGVKWLKYLYDNGMGGCLADDMGLGKTVQAIALLCATLPSAEKPVLIVMPRSLLFNWEAEWKRFAPHVRVGIYYGAGRNLEEALGNQVILTTYALVRNDIEALSKVEFDTVILDESQHIKNTSAQMTQATLLLRADHRFSLSGTPIENNLGELYSLFRFLNPSMLGTAEEFNAKYLVPVQRDRDQEAMGQLRRKIFPFLLRRLKNDVLDELPDRIDQTLYVEMEPEHAAYYERRRRYFYETLKQGIRDEGFARTRFEMLQALSELRRIASVPESVGENGTASSKIPILADAVQEAVENGHKVVVFFNFIAGIELLGERLDTEGIAFETMTGATRDRKRIVERFQTDPRCKVLLMTLKTGGVGLNLTAADTVFIAEPWWNRAAEEQGIARLHRIGQKTSVHAFSVITKGTIEEKIQLLQQQKADLFEGLIASDASSKQLTEEDIDFMLG